jgi:hypothetical protein
MTVAIRFCPRAPPGQPGAHTRRRKHRKSQCFRLLVLSVDVFSQVPLYIAIKTILFVSLRLIQMAVIMFLIVLGIILNGRSPRPRRHNKAAFGLALLTTAALAKTARYLCWRSRYYWSFNRVVDHLFQLKTFGLHAPGCAQSASLDRRGHRTSSRGDGQSGQPTNLRAMPMIRWASDQSA